jgi:hypothetical protein
MQNEAIILGKQQREHECLSRLGGSKRNQKGEVLLLVLEGSSYCDEVHYAI